ARTTSCPGWASGVAGALWVGVDAYSLAGLISAMGAAEINEQAGTLYLPGLLDFKDDTPGFSPEKRQGIRDLAQVLAKHLPCFTPQGGQSAGCSEASRSVKLDTLVIAGHAGTAAVGSSAFRHNWNLANARALMTFSELLESRPQLNEMRNAREQSLFRLDGFLPPEGSKPTTRPNRRVELRLVMDPAPREARPPQ
ncbi:MAG: hypothetical protein H7838_12805, partial [Magnetococcus sp. DMHC-8]